MSAPLDLRQGLAAAELVSETPEPGEGAVVVMVGPPPANVTARGGDHSQRFGMVQKLFVDQSLHDGRGQRRARDSQRGRVGIGGFVIGHGVRPQPRLGPESVAAVAAALLMATLLSAAVILATGFPPS